MNKMYTNKNESAQRNNNIISSVIYFIIIDIMRQDALVQCRGILLYRLFYSKRDYNLQNEHHVELKKT